MDFAHRIEKGRVWWWGTNFSGYCRPSPASRPHMSALSDAEWEREIKRAIEPIHGDCSYRESSDMLRTLVKTGLLRYTDLQDRPERFFKAHRLLLTPARMPEASGFGVRFTVQFNLFAGTILGLGSAEQVEQLDELQRAGVLGCFCLTEAYAGVNSGLVVQTTATWSPERQQFLIESMEEGAKKNWISQGLTATHAVIIANLIIGDKRYGPHGFVAPIRNAAGELLPGVAAEDMGRKTVANDLDNARIAFTDFWVDKGALLSRFSEIRNNAYTQVGATPVRIEVLGQRLLTGRLAIAQAAVHFGRQLFANTLAYAKGKKCWAPRGQPEPCLSDIPHIAALFAEGDAHFSVLEGYNAAVEGRLNAVLRSRSIPDAELVESIAVSKIKSVQTAITLTDKLAREVGSYALMHEAGFGSTHWLLMCQFAEGDSRILMQKLARDSMKQFMRSATRKQRGIEESEKKLQFELSSALAKATSREEGGRIWVEQWQVVYALAEAVCSKHIAKYAGPAAQRRLYFAKL